MENTICSKLDALNIWKNCVSNKKKNESKYEDTLLKNYM